MNYTQDRWSGGNDKHFGVITLWSVKISYSLSHTAAILTCGWRIHAQASMGSWYKPRQQEFHRSLSKGLVVVRKNPIGVTRLPIVTHDARRPE